MSSIRSYFSLARFKNRPNDFRRINKSIRLSTEALESRECPANLIANPSVETPGTVATLPQGWQTNAYGTNAATFSYPSTGLDGQRSVRVDMTSRSSGDAKWFFNDVPVTAGQKYAFTDMYRSDVATSATVRYRLSNGNYVYKGNHAAPASATTRQLAFEFTAPANAVSATVFHLIKAPGYLITDGFSLGPTGTTPADTTSPSVSVSSPATNATVAGTVTLTAQASDNIAVVGVRFLVDGIQVGAELTASPYQRSWNSTTVADGNHTVVAIARDAAGNSTTSAVNTLIVKNTVTPPPDTTSPIVSVTSPAANATVAGTVTLSAQASDNVAVVGVRFLVDGIQVGAELTASPYQLSWNSTIVADGNHSLVAIARDAAGNSTPSAPVTLVVKNTVTPPPTSTNLVQNPSVESIGSNNEPSAWFRNSWGTNNASFNASVSGYDGSRAIRVEISTYASGDAKWYFQDVPVTPGKSYSYSDAYRSSRESILTARFMLSDGSFSYVYVASLPASSNWALANFQVVAPANAVSITMFHLIQGTGWLETDKYSLSELVSAPPGRGKISFAFDDGWLSQMQNAVPVLQQANLPASFYIITRANQGGASWEGVQNRSLETAINGSPADWSRWQTGNNTSNFVYATSGSDGTRSARIDVQSYSSGEAGWYFQDVHVVPGSQYTISHQYNSSVATSVRVRFTRHDGSVVWVDGGTLASTGGQWQTQQINVTAPANADAMMVLHQINQVGTLWIDNYSVKEVSPYSNPSYLSPTQIQSLAASGFEVGAHTMTHADLATLSTAGALAEVDGSRADLLSLGITPQTFVYPYGSYNTAIEQVIASNDFIGARSVNEGYNTSTTDRYALLHQEVNLDTSIAEVQSWIDTAERTGTWLILTFHEVGNSGGYYRTTPETFRQIVEMVKVADLTPVSLADGISQLA